MLNTTNTPPTAPNQGGAAEAVGVSRLGSNCNETSQCTVQRHGQVSLAEHQRARCRPAQQSRPPAAAALVFMNTFATLVSYLDATQLAVASTEPPLKPNQPIHRMKVPRVASGRLAPGIALTVPFAPYLPLRAPSTNHTGKRS